MDWVSLAISVVSCLAGLAGLVVAIFAGKQAKEANQIAQDALEAAVEANGLAQDANEIAGEANLISKRAITISEDDLQYGWLVEGDSDGVFVLANDCAYVARNVSVTVKSEDGAEFGFFVEEMPGFGQESFTFDNVVDELAAKLAVKRAVTVPDGVFFISGPVTVSLRVYISWDSERGVRRSSMLECSVREKD